MEEKIKTILESITQMKSQIKSYWDLYQSELNRGITFEDAIAQQNKLISEKQKNIDDLTLKIGELNTARDSLTSEKQTLLESLQKATEDLNNTRNELSVCTGLLANRKDLAKYTTKEIFFEFISRIHV